MPLRIYRLTLPKFAGSAFSGEGALRVGGRWTPPGRPAVYASSSIALALLETLVHAPWPTMPTHLVIPAEVPDAMRITVLNINDLPVDWRNTPTPAALRSIGNDWLLAAETAILRVPSALVPQEWNYVLNPLHPDFSQLKIFAPEALAIDGRLRK